MPQKLVDEFNSDTILMNDLSCGELGEIVEHGSYKGIIVTKTHTGYVAVYCPDASYKAFNTTWDKEAGMALRVRRLKGQQVILSNE